MTSILTPSTIKVNILMDKTFNNSDIPKVIFTLKNLLPTNFRQTKIFNGHKHFFSGKFSLRRSWEEFENGLYWFWSIGKLVWRADLVDNFARTANASTGLTHVWIYR